MQWEPSGSEYGIHDRCFIQLCTSYLGKMDGGSVTGGNSHLLSEKVKRDHLHHFHKDDLENAFP